MQNKNIIEIQLDIVEKELNMYKTMTNVLVEVESRAKMRRFGVGDVKKYYLRNPDRIYSSFMKTFLYCRETETSLEELLTTIKSGASS